MVFDLAAGLYWRLEEGGLLFGWSDPDDAARRGPGGRLGRLRAVPRTTRRFRADHPRPWPAPHLGATIDYTPDHAADHRAGDPPRRVPDRRGHRRRGRRSRDDVGTRRSPGPPPTSSLEGRTDMSTRPTSGSTGSTSTARGRLAPDSGHAAVPGGRRRLIRATQAAGRPRAGDRRTAPGGMHHRSAAAGFAEPRRGAGSPEYQTATTRSASIQPTAEDLRWCETVGWLTSQQAVKSHSADLGAVAQLPEDGEPSWVGGGLQEQDVRIGLALHGRYCIDRCLSWQVSIQHSLHSDRGAIRDDHRDRPRQHRDDPRDRPPALRRCRRGRASRQGPVVPIPRPSDRTCTSPSSATNSPMPRSSPRSAAATRPPSPICIRVSASSTSVPAAASTSCSPPSGSARPVAPSAST